jgi:hypothetical protein
MTSGYDPEGFLALRNGFNFESELGPVAFRIAVYLAAKPDVWEVRESDVRRNCKRIGHAAYGNAISELVSLGMLARGARTPDGTKPPLRLSELFRQVRAGQSQSRHRKPDLFVTLRSVTLTEVTRMILGRS